MVTANNTERHTLFVAIIALLLSSQVYAQRLLPAAAATRPPVILLNGWQALCTTTNSTSANTFGQLANLLQADGAVVGFFNTCPYGDVSIEALAAQFGKYLSTLTYSDGTPVTQVDVVAHSMGGLIARAYLAGLQADGSLLPPANPGIRKLVLIATPNFGITQPIYSGVQAPEMIPGSLFLWNLARWNQGGDDLRGVDALAIIGNAGTWSSVGGAVNAASDGVVSLSSASLGFTKADASRTRIVPYCHTDPTFANTIAMVCSSAGGIANVTSESHYTGQIVRSFLAGSSNWQSIGGTPATDTFLSKWGGMFFAWVNSANQYVMDVSQVVWGPVALQMGGASGAIFYSEFVKGTDTFQATSQSLGTVNCGTFAEPAGYYSAVRCKFSPIISNVRPLLAGASGTVVISGGAITVNGSGFDPVYGCGHFRVVTLPPIETQDEAFNLLERFMEKKPKKEMPKRVGHG